MRSRYSAYAKGLEGYLRRTWAAERRPMELELDPALRWTGLDVRDVRRGSPSDRVGTVEFVATYELGGRPGTLHEISCFHREGPEDSWHYVGEDRDGMDGAPTGT